MSRTKATLLVCLLFTGQAQAVTSNDILAMTSADRLLFVTAWRDGFIHGTAVGVQWYTEGERQEDLLDVMSCVTNTISGGTLMAEFLAAVREDALDLIDDVDVALLRVVMDLCPIECVAP